MTAIIGTTGHICDPDEVNHPKHYNNHKSGLEAIVLLRHMNFNLGSAMKYLIRLYEKGQPLKDAKKALWYVQDEFKNCYIENINYAPDGRVKSSVMLTILEAEENPVIAEAMKQLYLFHATHYDHFANSTIRGLHAVIEHVTPPMLVFDNP